MLKGVLLSLVLLVAAQAVTIPPSSDLGSELASTENEVSKFLATFGDLSKEVDASTAAVASKPFETIEAKRNRLPAKTILAAISSETIQKGPAEVALPTGPLFYYTAGSIAESIVTDLSTMGRDGFISQGCPTAVEVRNRGKIVKAIRFRKFDGIKVSDQVDIKGAHTLFLVDRYISDAKGLTLRSRGAKNYYVGHAAGKRSAQACKAGWTADEASIDFTLTVITLSASGEYFVRSNSKTVFSGTDATFCFPGRLGLGRFVTSEEANSEFEVAAVGAYDRVLTADEIKQLENKLNSEFNLYNDPTEPNDARFQKDRFTVGLWKGLTSRETVVDGKPEYRAFPLTVEVRAKINSATTANVLVASDAKTSSEHWELYSEASTGLLALNLAGRGGDYKSKFNIADKKQHDIVAVLDTDRVKLYVDDEQVLDTPIKALTGTPENGGFAIGRLAEGGPSADGLVTDVRVSSIVSPVVAANCWKAARGNPRFVNVDGLTTFQGAVDTCAKLANKELCTAEQICASGTLKAPISGTRTGDSWVPVRNVADATKKIYVSVGKTVPADLCSSSVTQPAWAQNFVATTNATISSTNKFPQKDGVFCCDLRKGHPNFVSISDRFSWQVAADTCIASKRQLCTRDELCPVRGASKFPLGGIRTNEFWVPILDAQNEFVSIGAKDADKQLCKTYREIFPGSNVADWAADNQRPQTFKKGAFCCDVPPPPAPPALPGPVAGNVRNVTVEANARRFSPQTVTASDQILPYPIYVKDADLCSQYCKNTKDCRGFVSEPYPAYPSVVKCFLSRGNIPTAVFDNLPGSASGVVSSERLCSVIQCPEGTKCRRGECVVDRCFKVNCINGGSCVGGRCMCVEGFKGLLCELDPCKGVKCVNGGNCRAGSCVCNNNYSGRFCEIDPCVRDNVQCQNGGKCIYGNCFCTSFWIGDRCEKKSPLQYEQLNLTESVSRAAEILTEARDKMHNLASAANPDVIKRTFLKVWRESNVREKMQRANTLAREDYKRKQVLAPGYGNDPVYAEDLKMPATPRENAVIYEDRDLEYALARSTKDPVLRSASDAVFQAEQASKFYKPIIAKDIPGGEFFPSPFFVSMKEKYANDEDN